jgi:hypothetical protein
LFGLVEAIFSVVECDSALSLGVFEPTDFDDQRVGSGL